jgi:hypothetical protein
MNFTELVLVSLAGDSRLRWSSGGGQIKEINRLVGGEHYEALPVGGEHLASNGLRKGILLAWFRGGKVIDRDFPLSAIKR